MRIAIVSNLSRKGIINVFGRQNKEHYAPDEIRAAAEALRKANHTVETFEGDKYLVENLEAFMPRVLKGERPGMVFNLAYGIQGESRYTHIPSLLEMLGIPYVGSGPLAHSIALDKAMTKMVMGWANLPTPGFQVVSSASAKINSELKFPLIVKPKDEAVSFGVRVVENQKQLCDAIKESISDFQSPALVERFLEGREFNVGILGNGGDAEILPIVEIDLTNAKERIQTFETKKKCLLPHICPADVPEALAHELRELALKTFNTVHCLDCARIDFRLDKEGKPYILEINSMPAIHPNGSYFAAAKQAGHDYAGMINCMVKAAAVRYFGVTDIVESKSKLSVSKGQSSQIKIMNFLRASSYKMESRLEQLVNCNSHLKNKYGTDEVGRIMRKALEPLGFNCQVFPQHEIGDILLFQNYDEQQADALLLCHTDVFFPDWESNRKFAKDKNRIYGAGVAESKGGLIVLEFALRGLKYLRLLNRLRIKVLLTPDESVGNRYSRDLIQKHALLSNRALCFKLAGENGELITQRNGMGVFRVHIEGRGQLFKKEEYCGGVDAIDELAHKVRRWNRLGNPAEGTILYVTSVKAKARAGYMPENAYANISFLFPSDKIGKRLTVEIAQIAKRQFVSGSHCRLTGGIERPVFSERAEVLELYRGFAEIADCMGRPVGKIKRYMTSDINLVPGGVPAIDGLGPVGHNTRTENEYIEANTLVERSILVSLYLRSLARKTASAQSG